MKCIVQADSLQKKLSFINKAISTKAQLPILQNILLETVKGKLQISSTDLEIGIQATVLATVEDEGAITVPAKTFIELINSLSAEPVTLSTTTHALQVSTKRTKSVFQTLSSDEFPKLYEERGEEIATLTMSELKKDFSSVIFAASTDIAHPVRTGVLLRREEAGFLLVATDGFRLSLRHSLTSATQSSEEEKVQHLIVPARVFRELLSLREDGEELHVYVSAQSNQILFALGDTIVVSRLIEGDFPNFERIIPTDFSVKAFFDREELLKAVRICSIFARDSANIVTLSLKQHAIIVSSQAAVVGENTVEVEARIAGEENEIAFNARYLLELLGNLDESHLQFEMTGPLNPGVFKIEDNASYLHLIMPIKVQV